MKSFDADGIQFAWDAHSIKQATACPRLYQYTILEAWEPKAPNCHLTFGIHYATALEHFTKYIHIEGMEYEDALRRVVSETLLATWEHKRDEDGARIPGTGWAWESNDLKKNRHNLLRTIIWYLEFFREDPMKTMILGDGTP